MRDLKALALGLFLTLVSFTGAFAQCGTTAPANKFCGNDTGASALATWKTIPAGALTPIAGGTVLGNPTGALAVPIATTAPVLGIPGTSTGQIGLAGLTSGTAVLRAQAVAGSAVSLLPTAAGTLVGTATAPLAINAATGLISITGQAGAVLAGSTATFTINPVLGIPTVSQGTLGFAGVTSGTATITAQAVAGTPSLALPNTSGTFAVNASTPLVLSLTTGNLTCPTCATTTSGGAITGTAPITVSAGGVIALTTPLAANFGGTGFASYAVGDILFATTTTTFAKLADVATGNAIISGGVGVAPSYGKIGISTHVSGLGTNVATALAVNVGSAGAFVTFNGALGTPSSGTATNLTGLPVSSGISGLGTGVATALAVNIGTAGSFVVNGGALGSPSSAGTMPAFTLGGTVSGGGNQINNVIIGTVTPLAGSFTSLSSTTGVSVTNNANAILSAFVGTNTDAGASAAVTSNFAVTNAGTFRVAANSTAAGGFAILGWTGAGGTFIDQQNAAGLMTFRTGTTPTQAMFINTSQQVVVGTGAFTPLTGTRMTISNNAAVAAAAQTGETPMLQIVGADGALAVVDLMSFGASQSAILRFSQAGGTAASPTQTTAGQTLVAFTAQGYFTSGVGSPAYGTGAGFVASSTDNFTATAQGTRVDLYAAPTGGTTAPRVSIAAGMSVGNQTDPGAGAIQATAAIKSQGATQGIGYATGAGGAVTQITSRTTGVTLNTVAGAITLVSAAGVNTAGTAITFTVTDSAVVATDTVLVSQKSGTDKWLFHVTTVAAGSFQITGFTTGGTTVEQPVINFAVIKAVAN